MCSKTVGELRKRGRYEQELLGQDGMVSREQAGPGAEHSECRSARAEASGQAGQGSGQEGQVGSFPLKSPGPCVPCKPLYSA